MTDTERGQPGRCLFGSPSRLGAGFYVQEVMVPILILYTYSAAVRENVLENSHEGAGPDPHSNRPIVSLRIPFRSRKIVIQALTYHSHTPGPSSIVLLALTPSPTDLTYHSHTPGPSSIVLLALTPSPTDLTYRPHTPGPSR
jgi:hypothetical protein